MLLPQWQKITAMAGRKITAMADRIGTEIKSDREMNSAGDEILEYAIQYPKMAFVFPCTCVDKSALWLHIRCL